MESKEINVKKNNDDVIISILSFVFAILIAIIFYYDNIEIFKMMDEEYRKNIFYMIEQISSDVEFEQIKKTKSMKVFFNNFSYGYSISIILIIFLYNMYAFFLNGEEKNGYIEYDKKKFDRYMFINKIIFGSVIYLIFMMGGLFLYY